MTTPKRNENHDWLTGFFLSLLLIDAVTVVATGAILMHADITTAHATTTTTTTSSIHKNNKNTTTSKRSQKMTKYRDNAIRWGTAYCCCCKHYIRSDRTFSDAEFSGYLSRERIAQLRESNHAPVLAASVCRY